MSSRIPEETAADIQDGERSGGGEAALARWCEAVVVIFQDAAAAEGAEDVLHEGPPIDDAKEEESEKGRKSMVEIE